MTSDQNMPSCASDQASACSHAAISGKLDLLEEIVDTNSNDSTERIFDFSTEDASPCFVAVHVGAGYHSVAKTGAYRELCEKTCANVIELLRQGCKARTAVATAVALLEVAFIFHLKQPNLFEQVKFDPLFRESHFRVFFFSMKLSFIEKRSNSKGFLV
jgi:hypothetical protein